MKKQAHIEPMPQDFGESCEWEIGYTDYDGSHASFHCGGEATYWLVIWDESPWGDEWLYVELCQPHANLAMIAERQEAANA